MFTAKSERLSFLIFIIAAITVILTYNMRMQKNPDMGNFSVSLPFTQVIPSPTPSLYILETTNYPSPDGKKTLWMERLENDISIEYSFLITLQDKQEKQLVYSTIEDKNIQLTVPFNAWSPDNTYFFLQETSPNETNYYVFRTDGKNFSEDKQSLNVTEYFQQQHPELIIDDVTGWAGNNLLLVNTMANQETEGVSYWFTVSNQSITRLSTHFK